MWTIIGFVLSLFGFVKREVQVKESADDRRIGAQINTNEALAAGQVLEQQQAKASADAPKTLDELKDKLNKGEI